MKQMLTLLTTAAHLSLPVSLSLHDSVTIDSERIFLSDVAECHGLDSACDEIFGIDLGPAPEVGKTKFFSSQQIQSIVRLEIPDFELDILGHSVQIKSRTRFLLKQEIERLVIPMLSSSLSESQRIVIDSISFPSYIQIPAQIETLSLEGRECDIMSKAPSPTMFCNLIGTNKNKTNVFSKSIRVKLRREIRCPVAAVNLEKNDKIVSDLVVWQWHRKTYIPCLKSLERRIANRKISSSTVLNVQNTSRRVDVEKGQKLKLLIRRSGFELSLPVRAEQPGAIDDEIKVKTKSGEFVAAKIIDRTKVEMVKKDSRIEP